MNDKNIKIKWSKYFDHIWCISYIDKDRIDRYNHLIDELKRVDIFDSGIFEFFYQVGTDISKSMYENAETSYEYNNIGSIKQDYAKCTTLNHYYAIYISYLLGHKKILILEDDPAFLNNKQEIIDILEKYKNDPAECIKYEGTKPISDDMILNYGAACYSLNQSGMEKIIKNTEGPHMNIIDQYFVKSNAIIEKIRYNDYITCERTTVVDHMLDWKPSEKFICLQNFKPYIINAFDKDVLSEYNIN